jgi:hypothetical protein
MRARQGRQGCRRRNHALYAPLSIEAISSENNCKAGCVPRLPARHSTRRRHSAPLQGAKQRAINQSVAARCVLKISRHANSPGGLRADVVALRFDPRVASYPGREDDRRSATTTLAWRALAHASVNRRKTLDVGDAKTGSAGDHRKRGRMPPNQSAYTRWHSARPGKVLTMRWPCDRLAQAQNLA